MSPSKSWLTASDWSGNKAPGSYNGTIFTVGGTVYDEETNSNQPIWLRAPGTSGTQTFPYKEGGDYNWLYLGYNHDATDFDEGILNVKCPTLVIDRLVLGNGTVYQGNDNTSETIQGTITVNGNGTLQIHNTKSSDTRSLTVESAISGAGTLNFKTGVKTNDASKIGFYLNPLDSSGFTGNVIIDDKSKVSFEKANVFANASSITSAGDLTISANQTFKNLSGSGGSISIGSNKVLTLNNASNATYDGSISGAGSLIKTGSGELTISGTLNYTGDTTISSGALILSGSVHLHNLTGSGNLVYNSPANINILKLEYSEDKTFDGIISGTSSMEKLGSGNLTLTQAPSIGPTNIAEGNLILEAGGTLLDLSGSGSLTNNGSQALTINYSSSSSNLHYSGNITNNSSQALTINYYSNQTYSGNITNNSSQDLNINVESGITVTNSKKFTSTSGKLVKTGAGTLKITSHEDASINCAVDINEGTMLLQESITGKNRFGGTLNINSGGTLECEAKDSLGNGTAALTYNINGGTLLLNTSENQTFMNKTVNIIGGVIKAGDDHPECHGIEIKSGTTLNGHAAADATASNPTVSTIAVPIKVRENELLNITVDQNAKLIFTSAIHKANNDTIGINKLGPGVLVFSGTFWGCGSVAKRYNSKITVSNGVLQLRDEAIQTYGPVEVATGATLELYVDSGETKNMTIEERTIYHADVINSIFSTGVVKKTGDGTLKIVSETQGMISAESMFVSSGRLDMQGYFKGLLSVDSGATFSPGNSPGVLIIGDQTYGGGFILNEAGAELLMDIRGTDADQNDALIVDYGNLELHDGSIVYLAATDNCTLEPGDTFTAVLSGSNSAAISSNFISKYVRSSDFNNLEYVQLTSGAYSGKYAITGRRYIDANAVPEPSTWALLILGVAGLLCLKKLQKKKF